jgi:hypothetical protein
MLPYYGCPGKLRTRNSIANIYNTFYWYPFFSAGTRLGKAMHGNLSAYWGKVELIEKEI